MEEKQILELKKEIEIETQDNLSTSDPIFVVYEWEKVWSNDEEGELRWIKDCEEYTEEELVGYLREEEGEEEFEYESDAIWGNDLFEEIAESKEYSKRYFTERRRFISVFLTRKAAQLFIDKNSYHWRKPHIYVESLWRNYEMQEIRNHILNYKKEN